MRADVSELGIRLCVICIIYVICVTVGWVEALGFTCAVGGIGVANEGAEYLLGVLTKFLSKFSRTFRSDFLVFAVLANIRANKVRFLLGVLIERRDSIHLLRLGQLAISRNETVHQHFVSQALSPSDGLGRGTGFLLGLKQGSHPL